MLNVKPPLAPKGNPRARSAYVLSAYPGEEAVATGTVIANVHSEGVTLPTPRSVEDNTRTMLRILLIEDHPHLAEELRTTLEELVDAHIVATAAAEADACAWMDGRTNGCAIYRPALELHLWRRPGRCRSRTMTLEDGRRPANGGLAGCWQAGAAHGC